MPYRTIIEHVDGGEALTFEYPGADEVVEIDGKPLQVKVNLTA